MKIFLVLFLFFLSSGAFASATRVIDADTIKSADHTKTFTISADGTLPISQEYVRDSFTSNSSTTAFTLSFAPPNTVEPRIFLNGILQTYTTDYTISSTTLTFVTAPTTGQEIKAIYSKY